MAGYRFDYTVTPTDERSITQDGSWKGSQYSGSSDKRLDKKGSWLSSLKSVGETDQNTGMCYISSLGLDAREVNAPEQGRIATGNHFP